MTVTLQQAQSLHSAMKMREYFYKKDSDPLMIKFNLGEITKEQWQAARQAVKDAHPYPEGVDKAEALQKIEDVIADHVSNEDVAEALNTDGYDVPLNGGNTET